jgi:hypothetical protein
MGSGEIEEDGGQQSGGGEWHCESKKGGKSVVEGMMLLF